MRYWLLALLLLPLPAWADPGAVAEKLPFTIPGIEAPKELPKPAPVAPEPAASQCAVSAADLPSDFIKLMSRLEAPVTSNTTGVPPLQENATGRSTPNNTVINTTTPSRRTMRGVEVYSGRSEVKRGVTQEHGVTVQRGFESSRPNSRSSQSTRPRSEP